ncbi:hypothetical protein [Treponema sp.]|uniref:hypothetical protein n=1 Tax=Treponema sp. TaxID=166 RepID=UPI003EFD1C3E
MTEIERNLYGKCRTAFETSCGAEFRLYSDEKFSAEAMKILKSKDFSFSLEESDENQQSCFSAVLSPKETYACLCFIAKIRHEEKTEQSLKKVIESLVKNAEVESERP